MITPDQLRNLHRERAALRARFGELDDEIKHYYERHGHTNSDWAKTERDQVSAELDGMYNAAALLGVDLHKPIDELLRELAPSAPAETPSDRELELQRLRELVELRKNIMLASVDELAAAEREIKRLQFALAHYTDSTIVASWPMRALGDNGQIARAALGTDDHDAGCDWVTRERCRCGYERRVGLRMRRLTRDLLSTPRDTPRDAPGTAQANDSAPARPSAPAVDPVNGSDEPARYDFYLVRRKLLEQTRDQLRGVLNLYPDRVAHELHLTRTQIAVLLGMIDLELCAPAGAPATPSDEHVIELDRLQQLERDLKSRHATLHRRLRERAAEHHERVAAIDRTIVEGTVKGDFIHGPHMRILQERAELQLKIDELELVAQLVALELGALGDDDEQKVSNQ